MRRIAAVAVLAALLTGSARSPATTSGYPRVRGLVLTETIITPPGPTGWPTVEFHDRVARAIDTLWYRDPSHWRLAGHYLQPPDNAFLLRNGLISSPFTPFPGIIVENGPTIWHYSARTHSASRIAAVNDGMNPLRLGIASLSLDNYRATSLTDLLSHLRRCRSASRHGARRIAGRLTYRIDVGPDRCDWNSNAAALDVGGETAWVDTRTLLLLRLDKYYPRTGHRLLFRDSVVHIAFRVRLKPNLFRFSP